MGSPHVPLLLVQAVGGSAAGQERGPSMEPLVPVLRLLPLPRGAEGQANASADTQAWGARVAFPSPTTTLGCAQAGLTHRRAQLAALLEGERCVDAAGALFPPALGKERLAKCRMLVGSLLPAGVHSPHALLWFIPGPVPPMLSPPTLGLSPPSPLQLSGHHLPTPLSAAPMAEPSQCPQPLATGTVPWWHKVGCEGCSHRRQDSAQRALNGAHGAGADSSQVKLFLCHAAPLPSPRAVCWGHFLMPTTPHPSPRPRRPTSCAIFLPLLWLLPPRCPWGTAGHLLESATLFPPVETPSPRCFVAKTQLSWVDLCSASTFS